MAAEALLVAVVTLLGPYLQVDHNTIQSTSAVNDFCCHIAKSQKSVPLQKVQDVELVENCCLTCFGLKQVRLPGMGLLLVQQIMPSQLVPLCNPMGTTPDLPSQPAPVKHEVLRMQCMQAPLAHAPTYMQASTMQHCRMVNFLGHAAPARHV
jgi:hypothetical protein